MRLFILTTDKDRSLPSILSAADKFLLTTTVLQFHKLSLVEGKVFFQGQELHIRKKDKILIRWPWDAEDTKIEYNFFVTYFTDRYEKQIFLDGKCLRDFTPFYEDKLFQAGVFTKMHILTPKTWYFSTLTPSALKILPKSIVVKKRISSRGKSNYLLRREELSMWSNLNDLSDYIIQEYIPLDHDLRLLFYKGKLLGVIDRTTHVRKSNLLTVKDGKPFVLKGKKIITDCLKYCRYLGEDFVGCDVLLGRDGNYYVIEVNLSPQFESFEKKMGFSVGEVLIRDIQS